MVFKVVNVIPSFNSKSGGPPRTVSLIAAAGIGHWRADLFTTAYRESSRDTLLLGEYPGHVNVFPPHLHSTLGGLSMLAGWNTGYRIQLLSGVAPDVIHLHGMWSPFLAAFGLCAIRFGIPYIVAPHGMLEPWSLTARRQRKRLALSTYQGLILARASALHATSEQEAENLLSLKVSKAPVYVVPNAVREPGAGPLAPAALPSAKRTLLFVSRIHEKKGLDLLLAAWNALRPAGWNLLIVGSGETRYVDRLKQYVKAHGLSEVEFRSHLEGEALEETFRSASLFVLPTYSENFGNVVAEALIRGLPVITTTGTPWSQLVANQCGWYIEPTLEKLTQALAEGTSSTPAVLHAMGERGRTYAMANFTLPSVRQPLIHMYEHALQSLR